MPKPSLQCPFCSKTSSRGAGLASHIRSAHSRQYAKGGNHLRAQITPSAPEPARSGGAPLDVSVQTATSPLEEGSNATLDLLGKAYVQLTGRKRVIEGELSRFDDLRKELEAVSAQIESLKNTVALFGIAKKPESSPRMEEAGDVDVEAPTGPPVTAIELPFAGNKRDFVSAIVKAHGAEGVTPKEITAIFSDRKIAKGTNLIYNALSLFVKQGEMKRGDGRYFSVVTTKPRRSQRRSRAK